MCSMTSDYMAIAAEHAKPLTTLSKHESQEQEEQSQPIICPSSAPTTWSALKHVRTQYSTYHENTEIHFMENIESVRTIDTRGHRGLVSCYLIER